MVDALLLLLMQRYNFESNSQPFVNAPIEKQVVATDAKIQFYFIGQQ